MLHNDKGDLITGDSNGTIYVWAAGGNVVTNYVKHGHEVNDIPVRSGEYITASRSHSCTYIAHMRIKQTFEEIFIKE